VQQLIFDYTRQNTKENQSIFDCNKEHFSNQCRIVLEALLKGERLTTTSALLNHGIGDLRARVRDLIKAGIEVKKELKEGRYKEYYL
jgi:hypothetical protein